MAAAKSRGQAALRERDEARAHQAASAEILRVIGSFPADPQAVFDAIVKQAARLFAPCNVGLAMREGDLLHLRAMAGPRIASLDRKQVASVYPLPYEPDRILTARVVAQARTLEVPDSAAPGLPATFVRAAKIGKFRSAVFVPLVRDGRGLGAIVLNHPRPGFRLRPPQLRLLEGFAAQAVIAIENARLLAEISEKTRQLEVAGRHKSEFLANLSHELRTPLSAVIGFAEVMQQGRAGPVAPKQGEYLENIRRAGEHLLALANDILDLSKAEAGRMEIERTRFDLARLVGEAMTQVRPRAMRDGIALEKALEGKLGEIEADERKVKQVLLNLLSNAVKFTPHGGNVLVRAFKKEDFFEIAVKDTGVGISAEDQKRLFENFSRVGDRRREGSGLGLALSKRFVELHGGTIRVESALGKGSTFTVSLPLRP